MQGKFKDYCAHSIFANIRNMKPIIIRFLLAKCTYADTFPQEHFLCIRRYICKMWLLPQIPKSWIAIKIKFFFGNLKLHSRWSVIYECYPQNIFIADGHHNLVDDFLWIWFARWITNLDDNFVSLSPWRFWSSNNQNKWVELFHETQIERNFMV